MAMTLTKQNLRNVNTNPRLIRVSAHSTAHDPRPGPSPALGGTLGRNSDPSFDQIKLGDLSP